MIEAERVEEIFRDCLYREEEVVNGKPVVDPKVVQGVTAQFGLHPQRLESYKEEVKSMLQELPDSFQKGDTFLHLCNLKDDDLWTGFHRSMEQLMCLGLGLGYIRHMFPKDLWEALPGGMPVVRIEELK